MASNHEKEQRRIREATEDRARSAKRQADAAEESARQAARAATAAEEHYAAQARLAQEREARELASSQEARYQEWVRTTEDGRYYDEEWAPVAEIYAATVEQIDSKLPGLWTASWRAAEISSLPPGFTPKRKGVGLRRGGTALIAVAFCGMLFNLLGVAGDVIIVVSLLAGIPMLIAGFQADKGRKSGHDEAIAKWYQRIGFVPPVLCPQWASNVDEVRAAASRARRILATGRQTLPTTETLVSFPGALVYAADTHWPVEVRDTWNAVLEKPLERMARGDDASSG